MVRIQNVDLDGLDELVDYLDTAYFSGVFRRIQPFDHLPLHINFLYIYIFLFLLLLFSIKKKNCIVFVLNEKIK